MDEHLEFAPGVPADGLDLPTGELPGEDHPAHPSPAQALTAWLLTALAWVLRWRGTDGASLFTMLRTPDIRNNDGIDTCIPGCMDRVGENYVLAVMGLGVQCKIDLHPFLMCIGHCMR
jgi:hypothetical protein